MTKPDDDLEGKKPNDFGGRAWVRTTDDVMIDVFEVIRQRRDNEREVNLSLMRPGDILGMLYSGEKGEKGELTFKVERIEVEGTGLNVGAPKLVPVGRLRGSLSGEITDRDLRLIGSAFGSFTQFGVIGAGGVLRFASDGEVYTTPKIEALDIYHPGMNGEVLPVSHERSDIQEAGIKKTHDVRVDRVKVLMNRFGFGGDFEDCSSSSQTDSDLKNGIG